jgi:hypothetical protein
MSLGSFEPVVDDNWDKGVYAKEQMDVSLLQRKPFSTDSSSAKDFQLVAEHAGTIGWPVFVTFQSFHF